MPLKIDTLYYELDARTAGFEQSILRSQHAVDDFAKFVINKPMLAVAAFGAGLLAIGVEAAKMADDVDVAMRKVVAAFPQAGKEIDRLRGIVEQLSEVTPRSQVELAEAAAHIASVGVDSVAELQLRLRKAVDIADATGADLQSVIEGLDTVGDAFGLSAKKAADAVTQIFGAAQGKVGIEEVFTTLERGGSVLASLSVTATQAGEAMVALIDAGIPRRQAGTVLTTILELTSRVKQLKAAGGEQAEVGRLIEQTLSRQNVQSKGLTGALGDFATQVERGNRDLSEYGIRSNTVNAIQRVVAASVADTRTETEKLADAQAKLEAAAATNRESASALAKILKNELSESLIRLGNDILPVAIKLIDGLTSAMRRLKGEGNPLKDIDRLAGKVPTVEALGRNSFRRGTRFETDAEKDAANFNDALTSSITRAERYGADAFSGFTPDKLQQIKDNVAAWVRLNTDRANELSGGLVKLGVALNGAIAAGQAAEADTGKGTKPGSTTAHIDELTKEVKNAIAALRRSVEQALVGETETKVDDARQRVAAFREEVAKLEKEANRKLPDLEQEGTRLEGAVTTTETKERVEAARKVADEVAQAMGLQSRVMEQGLKDFLADVKKRNDEYAQLGLAPLFSPDQIEAVRSMRQALIDTTAAAERADAAIVASHALSNPDENNGKPNLIKAAGVIDTQIDRITAERDATSPDTPAGLEKRKRLQAELNKLQAEMNALRAQNDGYLDKETQKLLAHTKMLQDQAQAINSAVGLVLQLGEAFGLVSANTATMLQNITNGASAIGPFLDALKTYKAGTTDKDGNPLMTIGGLVGAAQPVIGGAVAAVGLVSSLFAESPEEKERKRLLQANNAAIALLTKGIGDLGRINITGTDYDTFEKLLNDPRSKAQNPVLSGNSDYSNKQIGDLIRAMGLSADELRDFAKQFGLSIGATNGDRFTFDDLEKLRQAIKASELTTFGDTFAGQLQEMDAEIKLFDITDPIKQLELYRKAIDKIKGGGGVLQETIDKFDTSTAEGLQAAQEAIQALFKQLQDGTLDPSALGGLTAQQFLDALEKEAELLKAAQTGGTAAGTGGFNVDRTITETTGSRLAAIASTSQIFLEQIADNTAAMARAFGLTGTALPPLTPPPSPAPNTSTSGGGDTVTITIGDIIVQVGDGAMDPTAAAALGGQIGASALQAINRGLGRDLQWRARARGNVTR